MQVLLVHPEVPITYWGFQHSLPLVEKRASLPPLSLVTLAALLPKHWELRLIDMNITPLTDQALQWADAVLVGGMLIQLPSMLQVLQRAKSLGRKTIVGGPACTTSPHLFAEADHVFLGEAEERQAALVAAVEGSRPMPHLLEGLPKVRPSLTHVPVPRFELLDVNAYCSMSIQYSRGCPYSCEFCDIIEIFGRVPRVKSASQVLAELDTLYALGFRGSVFFVDDNFIGNKRAVGELLLQVTHWQAQHGNPFTFYTEASLNLAKEPDLLAAMVNAGFCSVFVGIESPSTKALQQSGKKQNVGVDLRAAVRTITRAGLEVFGGFIVGFDSDSEEIFEEQRALLENLPVPLAMVGLLMALPGTALARRLATEGRLRQRASGDQFGRPNFEPTLSESTLLERYALLMKEIYGTSAYYGRCEALLDDIGPPSVHTPTTWADIRYVLRSMLYGGLLGHARIRYWRLLFRGIRRGLFGLRIVTTMVIRGYHLMRYTEEHLVPRMQAASAEALADLPQLRMLDTAAE
jgi:radical SAM superfamily enzyme YgiQ (UPF0313 family)